MNSSFRVIQAALGLEIGPPPRLPLVSEAARQLLDRLVRPEDKPHERGDPQINALSADGDKLDRQ